LLSLKAAGILVVPHCSMEQGFAVAFLQFVYYSGLVILIIILLLKKKRQIRHSENNQSQIKNKKNEKEQD
jgi:hypothetical protein